MDDISIRPATLEDAVTIYRQRLTMFEDIWKDLDPNGVATMKATFVPWVRSGIANGTYHGWLACNGDGRAVAGGGLITHEWMGNPRNPDTRRAYIANIYTEPAYRHGGIARRIMHTIIEWCRAEGFQMVSLHASSHGRSLYESFGFGPTNEMRLTFE